MACSGLSGKRAVLSYDATWTQGSDVGVPTWTPIDPTVDLSFAGSKGESDVSSRVSEFTLRDGSLKDAGISFGYRPAAGADPVYELLVDSWLNDTPMLILLSDQDPSIVGSKGWQLVGVVFELGEEYPHTDGALVNCNFLPFPGCDASDALILPSRFINAGP